MGVRNNASRSEFLGMPHGTAANRLRKQILFDCIQKLNLDSCFACGEKILSADELSIEHKKPWEGISVDLYWDLDNIAFSHLKCNRPHRQGHGLRKVGPQGTAWCIDCQRFRREDDFYRETNRWNGRMRRCKQCSDGRRDAWTERKKSAA